MCSIAVIPILQTNYQNQLMHKSRRTEEVGGFVALWHIWCIVAYLGALLQMGHCCIFGEMLHVAYLEHYGILGHSLILGVCLVLTWVSA